MLYHNYPSNPNNYCHIFTHWNNLMGESSLQMWTDYPEMTTVTHPYSITTGSNFIDIIVDKDNGPVEDAWVTILMDEEIFESGYTDAQGFVRLPITSTETDEVLITVTKKNHYPYQSSFQIHDPGVAIGVAPSPYTIDDDDSGLSNGNGDLIANGGETLEIFVSAKNYGSEDATNVIGYMTSTSGNVSIDTVSGIMAIKSGTTLNMKSATAMTINSETTLTETIGTNAVRTVGGTMTDTLF